MISNQLNQMQRGVTGITQAQRQEIETFMHGAVISFVAQNGPGIGFKARTLFGGFTAASWANTPLQHIVDAYNGNYAEAAKACGRLLFNVIQNDRRHNFRSTAGRVKSYHLV